MPPTIIPTYKAQPDLAAYGLDALEAKTFDRSSYLKECGEQAPPWDPKRRIQRWADSRAANRPPSEMYVYYIHEQQPGGVQLRQLMITNAEACKINLPGAYVYPMPVVKPSGAWNAITNEQGEEVGKNVITPQALSDRFDALKLIEELRRDGITVDSSPVEASGSGVYAVRYDLGETRRVWNVVINGGGQNAGLLLEQRNKQGIGAPGKWVSAMFGGGVVWQPMPVETALLDTRPPVPAPMRELLSNEAYRVAGFSVGIKRTDKVETVTVDNQSNLAANVAETLRLVKELVAR
jgi:hypothetical protein